MSQSRATRARTTAEHPLVSPTLVQYILAFVAPSVMVRSTCTAFRAAIEQIHTGARKQHLTVAADAVASPRLHQWAVDNGLKVPMAQDSCVRRGDLNGFCFLHATYDMPLRLEHAWLAAERGHLHMLQWLHQNNCPWDRLTCSSAAENGHLEVLQWAQANGCPWDSLTCSYAARGRYLEVLQWAHANGCPWDERTCREAAERGHLAVLQWARQKGCPWDACASFCAAAEGGHLQVLQWIRASEYKWNVAACMHAAKSGHLEVLQWLRANGCPWNHRTCSLAASGGHVEVLEWARANGCPCNKLECEQAIRAGARVRTAEAARLQR